MSFKKPNCTTCKKRLTCTELCSKALLYVTQDYVSQQELLLREIPPSLNAKWPDIPAKDTAKLTPRQRVILTLICAGISRSEIAKQLKITRGNLRVMIHKIMKKINE